MRNAAQAFRETGRNAAQAFRETGRNAAQAFRETGRNAAEAFRETQMRPAIALILMLGLAPVAAQQARGQTPPSARAMAPVDLTGYWVSVVSEDWQWRMITPAKGDYASLPLNPEGIRVANQWNPADEGSCKAYGAAAIMRMPGRVHITWEDESTLKIESDAGQQTRRLRFNSAAPAAGPRAAQGHSLAQWQVTGPAPRWGTLKVVTTNMRAGWLRKNGVPYSENAVMTEYFDRFSDGVDEWFTVTTMVEDPAYLTQPLVVSSNFKKERDGSRFKPTPCKDT
jgi:hypothetical protein